MTWAKIINPDGSPRTVETIYEGGFSRWKPDPRLFLLPSGRPARRTRDGLGCATYADGIMFWGTPQAVDEMIDEWLALPAWVRRVMKATD